jgi:hypothetical protein
MKTRNYLLLFFTILSVGCTKEIFIPNINNYLKATIDGNPFIVYQDKELNNDTIPNTFSFTFGQSTTNKVDTCLYFSVCLNRNNLYISFPKPAGNTSYTIYRQINITGQPSAFYSVVPHYAEETELEYFTTENIMGVESFEGQPIGQIIIDKIDSNNRLIGGHFNFSAYSYKVKSDTYVPTNKVKGITNGEFYVQWDESFNL